MISIRLCEAKRWCEHNTGGASPSPTEINGDRLFVRSRKIVRTMLPYMQCISVAVCFPVSRPNLPLSTLPRQPISIPAQGSPYTIKTVGGEAVRRFFSLKYAVLLYTLSTLFTDPPLRKQKSFRKVFCQAFFQKSVNASSHPRIPSHHRGPRMRRIGRRGGGR